MSEAVTNGKVAGTASFSMASKPPSLDVSQAFPVQRRNFERQEACALSHNDL